MSAPLSSSLPPRPFSFHKLRAAFQRADIARTLIARLADGRERALHTGQAVRILIYLHGNPFDHAAEDLQVLRIERHRARVTVRRSPMWRRGFEIRDDARTDEYFAADAIHAIRTMRALISPADWRDNARPTT